MPQRHIRAFHGLQPRLAHRLKDAVYAEAAYDAKLWDGRIRNFPCPEEVCDYNGADIQTITPFDDCECTVWGTETHFVKDCGTYFYTGDGVPKMASPAEVCNGVDQPWGLPTPATPTVSAPVCGDAKVRYVAYLATLVRTINGREYESPVSAPSAWYPICTDSDVTVTVTPPADGVIRLYRGESGFYEGREDSPQPTADWFHVGDTTGAFTDDLSSGDVAPRHPLLYEWGNPPAGLAYVGRTDSGVMVGLVGNQVHYTLPGEPFSWNSKRVRAIESEWGNATALCVHGENVYVLTDDKPIWYRVTMTETGPNLQRTVIQKHLPIEASQSLSKGKSGIVYASTNALILLNGDKAVALSDPWFNGDNWRRLKPETIAGTVDVDGYVFASETDAFLLEFEDDVFGDSPTSNLMGLRLNDSIVGASTMDASNGLRWAKNGTVYTWDRFADTPESHTVPRESIDSGCCPFFYRTASEDDNASMTYTAGELHVKKPSTVEFRYVRHDCGDFQTLRSITRTHCESFRLPGCRRQEDVYVELEGCGVVESLTLATSLSALRGTRR